MTAIFGTNTKVSKIYIPNATMNWSVDGIFPADSPYDNVALVNFSIPDFEVVDICRCFNDVTHVFSFGRDISKSKLVVELMMFLSDSCNQHGANYLDIKKLRENYDKNRVSKKTEGLKIQLGDLDIEGFLTGMTIDNVDPKTLTCRVGLVFLMKERI